MGKLSSLKPRLAPMKSRFALAPVDATKDKRREAELPWRKWYGTARWKRLRVAVWERDMFTCQMVECKRFVADPGQLVADHKIPHGGDHDLFWDMGNLQTLCKPCHDRIKQRLERRGMVRR